MAEFKGFAADTEAQFKQWVAYLYKQSNTGIAIDGVIDGVGNSLSLQVTQTATASTGVLVHEGMAIVQDTLTNGATPLVSNAQKTLDILVANPMGATPRNDIVVFDAATSSIRNIVGTPNASPTDPTVPATAVPLARLRNLASATTVPAAQIDDLRVFTGLVPQRGVPNVKHGRASVPGFSSSSSTTLTVSLSGMGFTNPHVVVTVTSIPSGSSFIYSKVSTVSASSFQIYLANPGGNITTGNINVDWIAVEG